MKSSSHVARSAPFALAIGGALASCDAAPPVASAPGGGRPTATTVDPASRIVFANETLSVGARVTRGGWDLPAPLRSTRPDATLVVDEGAGYRRGTRTGVDGATTYWTFDRAPEGEGDLVVAFDVSSSASDPRCVAFGEGTWIDARGRRSAVPAESRGEGALYRIPSAWLADSGAFPAVFDPTVVAETSVVPRTATTSTAGSKSAPVIVGSPTRLFATWLDGRPDTAYRMPNATFLDATGAAQNKRGLRLVTEPVVGAVIASAAVGETHLVAWDDGAVRDSPQSHVRLRRTRWPSVIEDLAETAVPSPRPSFMPTVAGVASRFVVGFVDGGTAPFVVRTLAVETDGTFVDAAGNAGPSFLRAPTRLASASDGTRVAIVADGGVTATGTDLVFTLASSVGATTRTVVLHHEDAVVPFSPTVAFDGANGHWVVAFVRPVAGVDTLATIVVDAGGDPITPSPVDVKLAAAAGAPATTKAEPWITARPGGTALFWSEIRTQAASARAIFGARIDAGGVSEDGAGKLVQEDPGFQASAPTAHWNGTDFVLAFRRVAPFFQHQIRSARFDGSLVSRTSGTTKLLSIQENDDADPVATFDGTNVLVAWLGAATNDRAERKLVAAGTSSRAVPLDSAPHTLWSNYYSTHEVALAFGGNHALASTRQLGSQVQAVQVDLQGRVFGPLVTVDDAQGDARGHAIASDGTDFLVAFARSEPGSPVHVRKVTAAGVLAGAAPTRLAATTAPQTDPAIAFGAGNYLVTWTDERGRTGSPDLWASRVDPSGTVLDPASIAVADAAGSQFESAVAFEGATALVVWSDTRRDPSPGAPAAVYAARLDPSGTILDRNGVLVADTTDPHPLPTVAGTKNGSTFALAWQDGTRVKIAHVDVAGGLRVLDPGGVVVAEDVGTEAHPTITPNGVVGQDVLAFVRTDAFADREVRAIVVTVGDANGSPCMSADSCSSRQCVDGVCCDGACTGTCATCARVPGTCTVALPGDDVGTCEGERTCGEGGRCGLVDGAACTTDGACASARCIDGRCCSSPCAGTCQTCSLVPGTCTPRPRGDRGRDDACAAASCDGTSGACPSLCTDSRQCEATARCEDGACRVARLGDACGAADQCPSGFCVDGVCCDGACSGQCEACDVKTALGRCTPVTGDPHGVRPACGVADPGDVCTTRTCDGAKSTTACLGFADSTVVCRPATCVSGVSIRRGFCTGSGTCAPSESEDRKVCAPFACGADVCLDVCDRDDQCSDGFVCEFRTRSCISLAHCESDTTFVSASGERRACSPYVCTAGACATACTSVDDCAAGFVCDGANRCVATNATIPDGGCGCRVIAREDRTLPSPLFAFVGLSGVALVRRSRRFRRSRASNVTVGLGRT
ncbi:MAG: hypothetical protein U0169_18545 [Polyangiaceae bacterium]